MLVEFPVDTTLAKGIKGISLFIWKESILMLKHEIMDLSSFLDPRDRFITDYIVFGFRHCER